MSTLSLFPTADTTLSSAIPDGNSGTSIFLNCGTFLDDKDPSYGRIVMLFSLSSIPANASIASAVLTLSGDGVSAGYDDGGLTYTAYRSLRTDWSETGATWNQAKAGTPWTNPGGDYDDTTGQTVTVDGDDNLVFDLSALATDALRSRSGKLSLIIIGPEATGDDSSFEFFECSSRQSTGSGRHATATRP